MRILQLESFIAENERLIKVRFDDSQLPSWKKYVVDWLKQEFPERPEFYSQFGAIINPKVVQIGNFQTMHEEQMKHTKLLLEAFLSELKKDSLKPEKLKEALDTLDSIITTYSNNFPDEGNDVMFLLDAYQKCIDFAITRFGKTENIMMLSAHHYNWSELKGDKLKEATKNIVAKANSLKRIIQPETNLDEKNAPSGTQFIDTKSIQNLNIFGKNINVGNNNRIESNEQNISNETESYSKLGLIVAIIVGIFVIAGVILAYYEFSHPAVNQNSSISIGDSTLYQDGVHGNIYVNKTLGFKIERPDDSWMFVTNITNFKQIHGINTHPIGILGEMLVGKSFDHDVVGVIVINPVDVNFINMRDYINRTLVDIPPVIHSPLYNVHTDFSSDGNYAAYTYESDGVNGSRIYHSVVIQTYNGKLYERNLISGMPNTLPQNISNDLNFIIKKFEILN